MNADARYDVFVSYATEDKPWVDELVAELRENGIRSWTFDDLAPGDVITDSMAEALRQSRTLIVVLSPHNVESPNTFFEIGAAIADHKRIIPVIPNGFEDFDAPPMLRNYSSLREKSPRTAGKRLASVIEENRGASSPRNGSSN